MFGLFKKRKKAISIVDRIWMNEQAKWQACFELYQRNKGVVFIAWFEESKYNLQQYLEAKGITAAHIFHAGFKNMLPENGIPIFIEHYPLQQEEQRKFTELGLNEPIVYSSLDEALFQVFGGERIVQLMHKMGIQETEMIQNSLISKSIRRAQEKIAEKTLLSGSATSQRDWLISAGMVKNF